MKDEDLPQIGIESMWPNYELQCSHDKRPLTWTTKYPTKPGYYWFTNYIFAANPRMSPVSKPEVVNVIAEPDGFLVFYRLRDSGQWCVGDFISAEWYGPIQPPLEPSECLVGRHPPGCPGHVQPPADKQEEK